MKYARLENSRVVEFFETEGNISEMFHPEMIWVVVNPSEDVEIGDTQSGSSWVKYSPSKEEVIKSERVWRDGELTRADIELNKVQDGDSSAVGSVTDWRTYRKALRSWPESSDFPDNSKRPVAPDAASQQ